MIENYNLALAGGAVYAVSFVFPMIAVGIANVYAKAALAIADFILSIVAFVMIAESFGGGWYGAIFTLILFIWIGLIWKAIVGDVDAYGMKANRQAKKALDSKVNR